MKKNFKFMLVALLAVFGFGVTMAVVSTQDGQNVIEYGNYVYKVTKMPTANTNGEVTMMAIAEGQQEAIADANGNLDFPGHFTYQDGSKTYEFNVTKMESSVFHDVNYSVKHAVIPKELTEIPTAAFNTLTNLYDLTFEEGSQVTKIGAQAFASTQITSFDFTPCVKLEGLMDGVFVQEKAPGQTDENVNANITTITLPTSTAFKHINGAFRNLKALTTINNLENSWIRELVDGAFSGCDALKTLNLPGNDLLYISKNALMGSAIEELKVNVGNGVTNGNPMKLLGGCTVDYIWDPKNEEYVYNYETEKIAAAINNVTAYNQAIENDQTLLPEQKAAMKLDAEVVEWVPADATTNLYGYSLAENATAAQKKVAPLKKLTIEGTLKGKICTNAFAWCSKIDDETITGTPTPDFDVSELEFGSKGQIQTHAFFDCTGIDELTLGDLADNKLGEQDGFTINHNAFEGCPIATLTLGDIQTANAIGSAAFGTSLKNVTIGSVKASAKAAFYGGSKTYKDEKPASGRYLNAGNKLGAFVWADNDGATLSLAVGGSLSNDTPETNFVIPAKTFDMSIIDNYATPKVNATIEIGEIASEGGVFDAGAFVGQNIEKITFKGDIAANGLQNAILIPEAIVPKIPTYDMQDKDFGTDLPNGGVVGTEKGQYVLDGGHYYQIDIPATGQEPAVYVKEPVLYTTENGVVESGVDANVIAATAEPEANKYVFVKEEGGKKYYKKIMEVRNGETTYNYNLKFLVFEGMIKTAGIGGGAFANFTNLEKLSFGGLLSKEAVKAGAFTNTGWVNDGTVAATKKYKGFIGTKEAPFVEYTADLTENDASENPFANGAFGTERDERIIYWSVSDEKLAASITAAILKDFMDNDNDPETVYDGEVVNPKFNVYKWVADYSKPEITTGFIVFPDNRAISLDQNINKKFAWGRYDLGKFVNEGKVAGQNLTATDMIITRFQKDAEGNTPAIGVTTGKKYNVKVTLYGVYWDEDDFAQQSSVYMVPLEVISGQYKIQKDNEHLIIVKVENLDGEFDQQDNQVLISYEAPEPAQAGQTADGSDFLSGGNSVWDQLQKETKGQGPVKVGDETIRRIFAKADFSWTNQELVDKVKNASGTSQGDVTTRDLYAMLNPSANAGFDIKRFVIERKTDGTGAYIGLGWYYALLNNYPAQPNGARIIWLDDAQATAIFGVKGVDVKEALRQNDGAIYNLQGVRVSKPGKGLYIQNGKKFIVK